MATIKIPIQLFTDNGLTHRDLFILFGLERNQAHSFLQSLLKYDIVSKKTIKDVSYYRLKNPLIFQKYLKLKIKNLNLGDENE